MSNVEHINKIELNSDIDETIKWFEKELIDYVKEITKIWGYEITINKKESNFRIEINNIHTVTVQYGDWEFEFIDNHEWIIDKQTLDDIDLDEDEILVWNENVNNLNKIIKFYAWFDENENKKAFCKPEDLKAIAKLFEIIKVDK